MLGKVSFLICQFQLTSMLLATQFYPNCQCRPWSVSPISTFCPSSSSYSPFSSYDSSFSPSSSICRHPVSSLYNTCLSLQHISGLSLQNFLRPALVPKTFEPLKEENCMILGLRIVRCKIFCQLEQGSVDLTK